MLVSDVFCFVANVTQVVQLPCGVISRVESHQLPITFANRGMCFVFPEHRATVSRFCGTSRPFVAR